MTVHSCMLVYLQVYLKIHCEDYGGNLSSLLLSLLLHNDIQQVTCHLIGQKKKVASDWSTSQSHAVKLILSIRSSSWFIASRVIPQTAINPLKPSTPLGILHLYYPPREEESIEGWEYSCCNTSLWSKYENYCIIIA